jgi:hypothetical protein
MHTVHLQNTMKGKVPITWVKHWLLIMQTGHYKNVCGANMTIFHFPIPAIPATPVL